MAFAVYPHLGKEFILLLEVYLSAIQERIAICSIHVRPKAYIDVCILSSQWAEGPVLFTIWPMI